MDDFIDEPCSKLELNQEDISNIKHIHHIYILKYIT